jgi:hypothetical protein
VLIDLRQVIDREQRQFVMLWYFRAFTDYIKYRGMAGRGNEILFVIDELADMLAQHNSTGQSLLAADMEELATRHARNYGVNLTVALQSLSSVGPDMQNVLMQLGSTVVGRIANAEDAMTLAKHLHAYIPLLRKKTEVTAFAEHSVEYTANEQYTLAADQLKQLEPFEFIVRLATAEGTIEPGVRKMSIANLDPGQYPDETYMAYIRACLRQAHGVPLTELLAEIHGRRPSVLAQPAHRKPAKGKAGKENKLLPQDGTIGDTAHESTRRTLPGDTHAPGEPNGHAPQAGQAGAKYNPFQPG